MHVCYIDIYIIIKTPGVNADVDMTSACSLSVSPVYHANSAPHSQRACAPTMARAYMLPRLTRLCPTTLRGQEFSNHFKRGSNFVCLHDRPKVEPVRIPQSTCVYVALTKNVTSLRRP